MEAEIKAITILSEIVTESISEVNPLIQNDQVVNMKDPEGTKDRQSDYIRL